MLTINEWNKCWIIRSRLHLKISQRSRLIYIEAYFYHSYWISSKCSQLLIYKYESNFKNMRIMNVDPYKKRLMLMLRACNSPEKVNWHNVPPPIKAPIKMNLNLCNTNEAWSHDVEKKFLQMCIIPLLESLLRQPLLIECKIKQ